MVVQRVRRIRRQAALLSAATTSALEGVVRARGGSSNAAGRATMFFISEGFTLDNQESDVMRKLDRVVDAAARAGTVVYTLYARGLTVGMLDASSSATADIGSQNGFRANNPSAELSATQEVLRGIAADTGGRALLNTNGLEKAVAKTLAETSNYYLLAWRPEGLTAAGAAPKFRKIELSVKGRSDLTVRVRRGFLNTPAAAATTAPAATTTATTTTANAALNAALNSPNARRQLSLDAYPVFTNEAQAGSVITASVQLAYDKLDFGTSGAKPQANVELACVLYNDAGKPVFNNGRSLALTSISYFFIDRGTCDF